MVGLDLLICSYHGHPGVLIAQLWPPGENNALYYTRPREPAAAQYSSSFSEFYTDDNGPYKYRW